MSTSRKIQIALGTLFLWSSTSVSSFAATNTNISTGKFQLDTVKLPVESTPVRSLNLTPDTYLIAGAADQIYNAASILDRGNNYIPVFEEALKKPDSKQIILGFCPSQPPDKVDNCWKILFLWSSSKQMQAIDSRNWDLMEKMLDINQAVGEIIRKR